MIKPFTRNVSKGVLRLVRWSLIVAVFVAMFSSNAFGQQRSDAPLTNAAVVKLVKAGFKEKTIISIINSRPNRFNLETEQLIQLKNSGVGENIILAMLSLGEKPIGDEDWADESFFRGASKPVESDPKESPQSGG